MRNYNRFEWILKKEYKKNQKNRENFRLIYTLQSQNKLGFLIDNMQPINRCSHNKHLMCVRPTMKTNVTGAKPPFTCRSCLRTGFNSISPAVFIGQVKEVYSLTGRLYVILAFLKIILALFLFR